MCDHHRTRIYNLSGTPAGPSLENRTSVGNRWSERQTQKRVDEIKALSDIPRSGATGVSLDDQERILYLYQCKHKDVKEIAGQLLFSVSVVIQILEKNGIKS